jgi:hypothetical protein
MDEEDVVATWNSWIFHIFINIFDFIFWKDKKIINLINWLI